MNPLLGATARNVRTQAVVAALVLLSLPDGVLPFSVVNVPASGVDCPTGVSSTVDAVMAPISVVNLPAAGVVCPTGELSTVEAVTLELVILESSTAKLVILVLIVPPQP